MKLTKRQFAKGFTLVELLVALALGLIVAGAAAAMFKSASDATQVTMSRSEMQQNARGAMAIMTRDLTQASIGMPQAGIVLPSGGPGPALAACGPAQCYLLNGVYPNNLLAPVVPFGSQGANNTDAITVAYIDSTWPLTNKALIALAQDGSTITVDPGTYDTNGNVAAPPSGHAYDNAVFGSKVGDAMMIFNTNGYAVATVTAVSAGGVLTFAAADPLNMNQPTATAGNIPSLRNGPNPSPNGPRVYPNTSAARINVVTYFIQMSAGPDGILGTADDYPILMRQLNAQNAIPLAEYVKAMQVSYDIYSNLDSTYKAALDGASVTNASEIRKINITLTLQPSSTAQSYTVSTSISPRNLSFTDRYK